MERYYEKGLNDAWKVAKMFFADMEADEIEKIFGKDWSYYKIMDMSPQEALAKLEAYEKEQAEIKVGDVLLIYGEEAIVTGIVDGNAYVLFGDGIANVWTVEELSNDKTGKYIDIQSVLQQIGGGTDELS